MATSSTAAYCEPAVLRWARESAGFTRRQAATEIGVDRWYLEMVEDGGEYLTLSQAERAADVYQRPLAALFLPTPPTEEPQEVQFRRLPGAPEPPWGPDVQLAVRRVMERQQVALEIYEAIDEEPPWVEASKRFLAMPADALSSLAREVLGVSREEQSEWKHDNHAPLRGWRDALEGLGVLVMQEGPVSVDDMRGFASVEPASVPAILVNNKDDPRARAFTAIHEFGHVLLALRGEEIRSSDTERWCDEFAGEVLIPTDWLAEEIAASSGSTLGRVEDAARAFHVTPLAVAVRIARTKLLPADEINAAIAEIRSRWKGERQEKVAGGGSYYRNQISKFGRGYLGLVFSALDAQVVTLPAASTLLDGVKVKNFESLRGRFEER
jgi:Zn-dependent peptidase ImmA (M78 family)/transcriptional regulator with XRE-family HTH domain